jgi:hypothetical protein
MIELAGFVLYKQNLRISLKHVFISRLNVDKAVINLILDNAFDLKLSMEIEFHQSPYYSHINHKLYYTFIDEFFQL